MNFVQLPLFHFGILQTPPARRAPQGRNCSCKYARKTPHSDGNFESILLEEILYLTVGLSSVWIFGPIIYMVWYISQVGWHEHSSALF